MVWTRACERASGLSHRGAASDGVRAAPVAAGRPASATNSGHEIPTVADARGGLRHGPFTGVGANQRTPRIPENNQDTSPRRNRPWAAKGQGALPVAQAAQRLAADPIATAKALQGSHQERGSGWLLPCKSGVECRLGQDGQAPTKKTIRSR